MITQVAQIVAALRDGAATSQEIANQILGDRRNVAVALCRLAALGVVERAGVVNTARVGRPCVRWRIRG